MLLLQHQTLRHGLQSPAAHLHQHLLRCHRLLHPLLLLQRPHCHLHQQQLVLLSCQQLPQSQARPSQQQQLRLKMT